MTKTLIYGIIALVIVIAAALAALFFDAPAQNGEGVNGTTNGFFSSLFPFNFGGADEGGGPLFEEGPAGDGVEGTVPRLRLVSANPVAGAYIFEQNGTTTIRFIDRATGHVYETVADETTVRRVTNTTVPGIEEVWWASENEFLIRYLGGDTIETFYVSLDSTAEVEQALNGRFIDSPLRATLDTAGESLFAVFEKEAGSADLTVSAPSGGDKRTVFSSAIRSWVPLQSDNGLFVYSAPLPDTPGFLYQVSGGSLIKVIGDVPGMTALINARGTYAIISAGETNSVGLALLHIETGELLPSPVDTLSSKCVFSPQKETTVYCAVPDTIPDGGFPNDWMLGNISFADSVWKIDFEQGVGNLVADFEEIINKTIDVHQPSISPDGNYLLFTNKNDLSLWSLRIQGDE